MPKFKVKIPIQCLVEVEVDIDEKEYEEFDNIDIYYEACEELWQIYDGNRNIGIRDVMLEYELLDDLFMEEDIVEI